MIQPLSKQTVNGALLVRPPEVESQITKILALEWEEVVRRAEISDVKSPEYLESECLVYLIRVNRSTETRSLAEQIVGILVRRCIRNLRNRIVGFSPTDTQDIADEILAHLIERIIEPSGRGDYFEVRFAQAFKFLRIDVCRKYRKMRAPQTTFDEDEGTVAQALGMSRGKQQAMLLRDALATLTQEELLIIQLRYISGVPINSKEQHPTIVEITKLSERTVRNRLRSAEEKLSKAMRE